MLRESDGLFRRVAEETAKGYPDVIYNQYIVDDFARRIVASPQEFDVVVMPNLYGDILSDAAAGTIGGLGLAPSGCYGENYAYFESIHGTAPDIAGKHLINPTATLLSATMMLEYIGYTDAGHGSIMRSRRCIPREDTDPGPRWVSVNRCVLYGSTRMSGKEPLRKK